MNTCLINKRDFAVWNAVRMNSEREIEFGVCRKILELSGSSSFLNNLHCNSLTTMTVIRTTPPINQKAKMPKI